MQDIKAPALFSQSGQRATQTTKNADAHTQGVILTFSSRLGGASGSGSSTTGSDSSTASSTSCDTRTRWEGYGAQKECQPAPSAATC